MTEEPKSTESAPPPARSRSPFAVIRGLAGLTLLSRLLGFARDVLMAMALGTGLLADAFFLAWALPNLARRLFGEGAFSAALVPVFVDARELPNQFVAAAEQAEQVERRGNERREHPPGVEHDLLPRIGLALGLQAANAQRILDHCSESQILSVLLNTAYLHQARHDLTDVAEHVQSLRGPCPAPNGLALMAAVEAKPQRLLRLPASTLPSHPIAPSPSPLPRGAGAGGPRPPRRLRVRAWWAGEPCPPRRRAGPRHSRPPRPRS